MAARIRRVVGKTCQDDADVIKHKCSRKEGWKHYQEGLNVQRSAARQEETGQKVSAVWLICQDLNELKERPSQRDYFCEGVLVTSPPVFLDCFNSRSGRTYIYRLRLAPSAFFHPDYWERCHTSV